MAISKKEYQVQLKILADLLVSTHQSADCVMTKHYISDHMANVVNDTQQFRKELAHEN